ncbi:4'-phosphopantetheinyl transferase superfamily protein [Pseudoclavibacter sp. RFBB5]|uniref:4'-phosphopantetheinyl transferase family protein n=1 Tax=Pseudoclavibacter sp. RFBB5 TaxID=2080574 RepID=UPI0015E1BF62|nr:4'-phosphopantetheinyl transferase superfamily protein [Pseudoclavibacter sp. RFBB5]
MIAVLAAGIDEVLDAASQCASEDDRVTASARRSEELRRRTLAGRAALRLLAAWGRGLPLEQASELEILRLCPDCGRAHGQPRSADLALSSSTSAGRVLVAIADPADAIGVDIETVPRQLWAGFDAYALHPDERARVVSDAGQPSGVAARIGTWTAKEAALKVSGTGLRTEPASLRVDAHPDPEHAGWHRVHGAPSPSSAGSRGPGDPAAPTPSPVSVRMLAVRGSARAAVATNRPQGVRLWTMPELLTELGCLPDTGYDEGELSHLT